MKVLKKAEQKNFQINKEMYTKTELENLMFNGFCFYLDDKSTEIYNIENDFNWEEHDYRVFAHNLDEVKVIYNKEFGFYETIGILYNGVIVHLSL